MILEFEEESYVAASVIRNSWKVASTKIGTGTFNNLGTCFAQCIFCLTQHHLRFRFSVSLLCLLCWFCAFLCVAGKFPTQCWFAYAFSIHVHTGTDTGWLKHAHKHRRARKSPPAAHATQHTHSLWTHIFTYFFLMLTYIRDMNNCTKRLMTLLLLPPVVYMVSLQRQNFSQLAMAVINLADKCEHHSQRSRSADTKTSLLNQLDFIQVKKEDVERKKGHPRFLFYSHCLYLCLCSLFRNFFSSEKLLPPWRHQGVTPALHRCPATLVDQYYPAVFF